MKGGDRDVDRSDRIRKDRNCSSYYYQKMTTAIREHVKMEDLRKDEGLKILSSFVEKKTGKRWHGRQFGNVKNCRREQDQKVGDYVHEFEKKI